MDSVHHIWCPLSSQEYQDLPDGAETTLTDIRRPAEYRAGTFRASHFVSIGEPNHSVPTEPDPRGTMTFLNGKNIIDQAPAYSVIYIQSNLPYSVPLENGHSTQAPTGVYAVSFNGVIQAYK